MELRLLLAAVRRGALVLVLALVIGVGLGYVAHSKLSRHYVASSTLLIDSGAILIPGQQPYIGDPERYISDQESILAGQSVADQVAKQVPGYDGAQVRSAISLAHVTGTNTVTITAKADSPEDAQRLANGVPSVYLAARQAPAKQIIDTQKAALQKQIDAVATQISNLGNGANVQSAVSTLLTRYTGLLNQMASLTAAGATEDNTAITDKAALPTTAVSSVSLTEAAAGGGLVLLLLGFGFVLIREVRRPHVMTKAHAEVVLDRDVVAALAPARRKQAASKSAGDHANPSATAKAHFGNRSMRQPTGAQRLASVIAGAPVTGPQRTIAVTSAVDDAAAAGVAKALATELVRQGSVVAVVDLMTGKPLARPLSRAMAPAQAEAPSEESVPTGELAMVGASPAAGTSMLAAQPATSPVRLPDNFQGVAHYRATAGVGIFSTDARDYAGALPAEFDVIIVQTPAVLTSGIAAAFSRTADDTVLVVPLGTEFEANLRLADELLREGGSRMHVVTYGKH